MKSSRKHIVFIKVTHRITEIIAQSLHSIVQIRVASFIIVMHMNGLPNISHQHTYGISTSRAHVFCSISHVFPQIVYIFLRFRTFRINVGSWAHLGPFMIIHQLCSSSGNASSRRIYPIRSRGIQVKGIILLPMTGK